MMKTFVAALFVAASSVASVQAFAHPTQGVGGSVQSSRAVNEHGRAVRQRGAGQTTPAQPGYEMQDDVLSTSSLGGGRSAGGRRVDILSSTGKVHSVPAFDIDAALDATYDGDDE